MYRSSAATAMPSPRAPLGPTSITPDNLSRPHVVVDGALKQTTTTFDSLDRATLVTYNDNSTISYAFDADGNLTSRQDNVGTTSFTFDALNRETQKTLPGATGTCPTATTGVHCFTYDLASNLTSYLAATATVANCNGLAYSVSVCYTYNTLNELTSLVDPSTRTTTFGYDLNHRRTTTTYPGNTVQTVTYDNAGRVSGVTAVNGSTTLTDYSYAYSKTINSVLTDTLLVQSSSQSDTAGHNATIADTYNALNRLTEWNVTVPTGSLLTAHDYTYTYDGNGNRTQIHISASNITNLFYNADNEWYQSTDANNNVNLISWDAAGNITGNNGFGDPSKALTVTYNAREQVATQTDIHQYVSPMTFTNTLQWERTADTDSNGSHSYVYDFLGMTRTVGSTASYVRDPSGNLVAQVPSSGGPYYYLTDGQGSVAGLADASGNQAASYFYCPTGNPADGPFGTAAAGNPFQYQSAYYDSNFQSYWMDGQQFDSNSGNAFALNSHVTRASLASPYTAPAEPSRFDDRPEPC